MVIKTTLYRVLLCAESFPYIGRFVLAILGGKYFS